MQRNMETYVKRNYGQKAPRPTTATNNRLYPFWDYRSRRGSSSANSSNDGGSISSMNSSRSESESENTSLSGSDSESVMLCDPNRLTLHIEAHPHESNSMWQQYQPILDWVDPDLKLLRITERTNHVEDADYVPSASGFSESHCARIPSLAITMFLHEDGLFACDRIQTARQYFEQPPWMFHHFEELSRGGINPYPYNSPDYFFTSQDLPLWAVRQVHMGKELIRFVIFTRNESWQHMIEFYKLINGACADVVRENFCLFTMHSNPQYDIQLALKRLGKERKPNSLDSCLLTFRVGDIGHLVPLFPNVCSPISDTRWQTTDHDGNTIVLEVTGHLSQSSVTSPVRPKQTTPIGFYV